MDATRNYHTERSMSERGRQAYHSHGESNTQKNISMRRKQNHDIEIRLVVTKGTEAGGMEWEAGLSRFKLLYTE